MSDAATDIWRSTDANPLLWLATGALAFVAHVTLLQVGVSAYQSRLVASDAPPPVETQIIATAFQAAGNTAPPPLQLEAAPVATDTPQTVTAQTLSATAPLSQSLQATQQQAPVAASEPMPSLAPQAPVAAPEPAVTVADTAPALAPDIVRQAPESPRLNQPGVAPIALAPVTPVAPDSVETEAPEPVETAALSPTEPTTPAASVALSPAQTDAPAPVEMATVAPSASVAPIEIAPTAPAQVVQPEPDPDPDPVALPDPAPALPPAPSDLEQDQPGVASANAPEQTTEQAQDTYATVLDFLRGFDGGDCFAALPVLAEDGSFRFETFAESRADLTRFRQALEIETGTLPGTVMKPVSQAQCDALPFVAGAARYPEFRLYFDIETREIASGAQLSGRLGNTLGGFVSLLLIDDEGVVQDLGSFLKFRPGYAGFDIPMTLKGSPVETQQLLMALSTKARLTTLASLPTAQAKDFFQKLALEILLQGGDEDVALVAFSVR